ncbi:hypothetical protein PSM7751_01187 [Pseudooceanicola marinus]|uniref:Uncharacterized protein n=1 Tax=Pseudooceanicola marinus TaxID=396013 RepID=A0A1X6YRP0_9RHOB|nr:hypothetical protein [Pseudooceanicola marinus]PJE26074.1 hypothetical protein CVM50_19505 [Pseudooceanicola marinus]SLN29164.1 hypothetical protein PSM7751_01187 [Pseudooceanicola marinus]
MDSYLQVVTHPFLWIAAGFVVLFYLVQMLVSWDSSKDDQSRHLRTSPSEMLIRWLKGNYVPTILLTTALLAILALGFYLFDIARAVHNMVGLLLDQTRDIRAGEADLSDSSDTLRDLAHGSALLLGVLAAAATIFFSVIRVWINDRNIRATEDGLVTDRINKAVEGLGKFTEFKTTQKLAGGSFQTVEETKPDLVVRIGSIQALERIAEDSERDRERIVVLLTEYIRENAR